MIAFLLAYILSVIIVDCLLKAGAVKHAVFSEYVRRSWIIIFVPILLVMVVCYWFAALIANTFESEEKR